MIDKASHIRVSPIIRIQNITHQLKEPNERELVEMSQNWPSVTPTIIIDTYYSMTGKLLSRSNQYLNTYA